MYSLSELKFNLCRDSRTGAIKFTRMKSEMNLYLLQILLSSDHYINKSMRGRNLDICMEFWFWKCGLNLNGKTQSAITGCVYKSTYCNVNDVCHIQVSFPTTAQSNFYPPTPSAISVMMATVRKRNT
jgi:hypothetical protein